MATRRDFLKTISTFAAAALVPLDSIARKWSRGRSQAPWQGEVYAGFVILPEGDPIPSFVVPPTIPLPMVCGVGEGREGQPPFTFGRYFDTAAEVVREAGTPVYTLSRVPSGLRPSRPRVVQHLTGEVFAVSLDFESRNPITREWESTVSIWAEPDFPRPVPLWWSDPVEPDGPSVTYQKVDDPPSPGLMVESAQGYVFHWIADDVYFIMRVENGSSEEEARGMVRQLTLVR